MDKKGLTLMEIIVSTLILALVMAGLVNLFISGKRWILHSRARMTGGELGRVFLDPLQMAVGQNTWLDANNQLNTGVRYCDGSPQQPGCPSESERTLNSTIYNAKYTINRDLPVNNINKVETEITWSEISP